MDDWLHLLRAAASDDRDACANWSLKIGYLTGKENEVRANFITMTRYCRCSFHPQVMLNAHVDSMTLLATPFKRSTSQPFAFGPGSHWTNITRQIRERIPIMLQHRLTPPPRETYSLNRSVDLTLSHDLADNVSRKLSGAFLLASRLGAVVDTKRLWDDVTAGYQFSKD